MIPREARLNESIIVCFRRMIGLSGTYNGLALREDVVEDRLSQADESSERNKTKDGNELTFDY